MDYKIKSRIWIESNNKVLMGEGRMRLLKEIDRLGSLSKAAKNLDISYKKAWTLVDAVNKSAKVPVTESSIGGKGGGGATLTDYGKELIEAFEAINKSCWKHLDTHLERIQSL